MYVSLNIDVYSIVQYIIFLYGILHYVIKFVSDLLGQVGGFLRFPPPIKLTATI